MGKQFCRTAGFFGLPFCILIFRIWGTQILRHTLYINLFYVMQQCYSKSFKISSNSSLGGISAERLTAELFGLLCLYFNFKNLKELNSRSFTIFQPDLRKSGVLSSVFQNFLKLKRGHLISRGRGAPILYIFQF